MPEYATPTKPAGTGDLRSINIRALENGFVGCCSYEPAKTKKGDMCCNWVPDKEYVLASEDAVYKFVSDALGFKPKKSGSDAKDLEEAMENRKAARSK